MREDNASDTIPPDRRRREVAAILARGVLRCRRTVQLAASSTPQKSANSAKNSLGLDADSSPCVSTGPGGYGPRDQEKGHTA